MSWEIKFKEIEGIKYYFSDIGKGYHYKPSFRLWISSKLVNPNKLYLSFPLLNVTLLKTEKGNWVLKPGQGIVYDIFIKCGFRGDSEYEIIKPSSDKLIVLPYSIYNSPLGNLGASFGALVYSPEPTEIWVNWSRSGRTYGKPKQGIRVYYPDGSIKEYEGFEDIETLEDLKRELTN